MRPSRLAEMTCFVICMSESEIHRSCSASMHLDHAMAEKMKGSRGSNSNPLVLFELCSSACKSKDKMAATAFCRAGRQALESATLRDFAGHIHITNSSHILSLVQAHLLWSLNSDRKSGRPPLQILSQKATCVDVTRPLSEETVYILLKLVATTVSAQKTQRCVTNGCGAGGS